MESMSPDALYQMQLTAKEEQSKQSVFKLIHEELKLNMNFFRLKVKKIEYLYFSESNNLFHLYQSVVE